VKAAYIEDFGDAESIRYGELPDPLAGPGQVVVRVEAVAVNTVDTLVRSGRWRTEMSFPLAVGRDLVGTVASVGPGVSDLGPAEQVWTNSAGYGGRPGATAELVAVERGRLYRLPPGADPLAFVASVHPGATAYGALLGRARLVGGERLAVIGANGAVGMCAVQVGAAAGAEVIAVVRHPDAAARLRELRAGHVVVADATEAPRAAAEAAGPLDVLIDTTGRADIASAPEHLAPRGRMLVVAGAGKPELDLRSFYLREAQLLGFIMSGMGVGELATAADWINATYPSRPLSVSVGRVLPFDAAADAHAIVETGGLPRMPDGTVGRIVLQPRPAPLEPVYGEGAG
jgi:NADPH:quinone reductase-like Zn-dependent oxidoreductase